MVLGTNQEESWSWIKPGLNSGTRSRSVTVKLPGTTGQLCLPRTGKTALKLELGWQCDINHVRETSQRPQREAIGRKSEVKTQKLSLKSKHKRDARNPATGQAGYAALMKQKQNKWNKSLGQLIHQHTHSPSHLSPVPTRNTPPCSPPPPLSAPSLPPSPRTHTAIYIPSDPMLITLQYVKPMKSQKFPAKLTKG